MIVALAIAAVCLSPPVDGPVVEGFEPTGRYSGHWGVDYAAGVDEMVRAPAAGQVTFAGAVAGMRTVTIEPVSGFKVSVSYLSAVLVAAGQRVSRGDVVGRAGTPHGVAGVHLSTRIEGQYVDPAQQIGCRETDISRALRLVTPPRPYARRRANRNTGRDIRSDPRRPSPHRRVCSPPIRSRSASHHSGRGSMAEVGPRSDIG